MPVHFGCKDLKILNKSSCTGTQFLHAVGAAEAGRYIEWLKGQGISEGLEDSHPEEVIVCCTGDGATSEGEWWEALNTATNLKLPVVFVVEDNGVNFLEVKAVRFDSPLLVRTVVNPVTVSRYLFPPDGYFAKIPFENNDKTQKEKNPENGNKHGK